MVHGEEKAREMARSLLPSVNREAARAGRVAIHRAHRRQFRVEMNRLVRDPESFDERAGFDAQPVVDIRQLMGHRRSGDKVAPFIRWATARARSIPRESRLSHIRALVPRGLIGDHALAHIREREEFQSPEEVERRRARRSSHQRSFLLDRGEQATLLHALLHAPGGHRVFNQWLKARHLLHSRQELKGWHCTCVPRCRIPSRLDAALPPARLLLGAHDVLPFLAAIWGPEGESRKRRRTPLDSPRSTVNTFLRAFKQCRGDVLATARVLGLAPPLPD
ncbi:hypothetical protein D187_001286 [Cystobacter fuscus DSM 2262]|uniref:Uncharacterized protein n=2 Tax=Cystobacter fuscus TaxID=43 RepID=S9QXV9_CYSF2|nr:hypothetical protein D187_001286 [Cystobacter fuscus DSM 2262]